MDPKTETTWKELTDAVTERNAQGINDAAESLIGWLEKDGFMPRDFFHVYGLHRRGAIAMLYLLRSVAKAS